MPKVIFRYKVYIVYLGKSCQCSKWDRKVEIDSYALHVTKDSDSLFTADFKTSCRI